MIVRIMHLLSLRRVQGAFAAFVLIMALFLLHRMTADTSLTEIRTQIAAMPWTAVALSFAGMAISFAAIGCYDVVGLRAIAPGRVPDGVAAGTGAAGFAISNVLGFGIVTGGSLRLRVYTALGLDVPTGAQVIGMANVWFWSGLVTLLASALLLHPDGLASLLPLPVPVTLTLGACALVILLFGGWKLAQREGGVVVMGHTLPLPTARFAALGTLAGMFDLAGSALALYALMPSDLGVAFPMFLGIYLVSILIGVLSLAPGGIGVFEATLIAGLGAAGRADVLAALALYRVIYYLLPFVLTLASGTILGARRSETRAAATLIRQVIRPVVPPIAAGLALVAGAVLLLSGALPAEGTRMGALRDVLPLGVIEASHLAGSVAGILLLVVARGLYLRRHRAWQATMALLLVGLGASMLKGLDIEEVVLTGFAIAALWIFQDAFYRKGASLFRLPWTWLIAGAALLALTVWVGLAAYRSVPYQSELWWRFAWSGDAPRFLRASLAASVVFGAVALNSLLTGRGSRLPPEGIPDAVRRIALASGNVEGQIALAGGKRYLVSAEGEAFLSYADSGGSLISKGDPVGDHAQGVRLLWQLREMADAMGRRAAFYAVWTEYLPTYLDMGLSILKIGEVARVELTAFSMAGGHRKGQRASRSRAAREGLVFEVIPAADLAPLLPELRAVSDAWLALKQGEEKSFAVGAFDENYLSHFDHAVLRMGEGGPILAFANLMQGGDREELSIDLMRHSADAPGYAMEVLFLEMFLWGQARGFKWFSLGAAPFAGLEEHRLASVWNRIGRFAYDHGEAFYHFEGLRAFKEKFDPVWTPNYLASPRGLSAAQILLEVNGLVSGGVRGLVK